MMIPKCADTKILFVYRNFDKILRLACLPAKQACLCIAPTRLEQSRKNRTKVMTPCSKVCVFGLPAAGRGTRVTCL